MSAQYEILPPGGHETYAEKIFRKIKSYVENKVQTDVPSNAVFTDKKATYYGVTSNNQTVTDTVDRLWFTGNDFACDPAATTTREDCIISLRYPNLVKQSSNDSTDAEYRILFSNTADDTERTEKVQKNSDFSFNPLKDTLKIGRTSSSGGVTTTKYTTMGIPGIDISEYVGSTLWSQLSLRNNDITLSTMWDGTHTSLKDTITYLGSQSAANKVDKAGDTMTGALNFSGSDIYLKTVNSSSDDSGDIVFYYGNGNEKSRIWSATEYTSAMGPNYRVYKKDGTALYNGRLATLGDLSWNNISGKPSSFTPAAHDHTYLNSAGTNTQSTSTTAFATGALNVRWFTATGKLPGQPSQYGFLATFATGTGSGENHQIFMAQANGSLYHRGTNSSSAASPPAFSTILDSSNFTTYAAKASHTHSYLPLSGGSVTGDTTFTKKVQVNGVFKCSVISRYDTQDNGYVNHVNPDNNAYRPVRASAFTTMSCKHTKTNVVDISEEDALKLLDIRPVNFDYVEEVGGQKDQIGVLAEDTYEILPKVVSIPDDYVEEDFDISKGIHQPLPSVDYIKFVPYLIKLVQIQQKEINELKTSFK